MAEFIIKKQILKLVFKSHPHMMSSKFLYTESHSREELSDPHLTYPSSIIQFNEQKVCVWYYI